MSGVLVPPVAALRAAFVALYVAALAAGGFDASAALASALVLCLLLPDAVRRRGRTTGAGRSLSS